MTIDADLPVVHNIAVKRVEISLDGQIAFSKYLLAGEEIIIERTEVPIELDGKGIASRIQLTLRRRRLLKPFAVPGAHMHKEVHRSAALDIDQLDQ
jgi:hypothetical protein